MQAILLRVRLVCRPGLAVNSGTTTSGSVRRLSRSLVGMAGALVPLKLDVSFESTKQTARIGLSEPGRRSRAALVSETRSFLPNSDHIPGLLLRHSRILYISVQISTAAVH